MIQPLVRILGMDATGKTTICDELEKLDSRVITFGATPTYAYRWLETYGIGRADRVTPDQIDIRQHVFGLMNEQEAHLHDSLRAERPVVAVRGRADTWISACALRDKPMPTDIATLFPRELRPDILVVLQAPLSVVESRLDLRREQKSGANSIKYHMRTMQMYEDLAVIARRHVQVLTFDTSNEALSPGKIALEILDVMDSIQPNVRGSHRAGRLSFKSLSADIREDVVLAKKTALENAYPSNKTTKVGCVLVADGQRFLGSNVKRWSWNSSTCAERMAIDQAMAWGIRKIERLIVYGLSDGRRLANPVAPCGSCREMLKETIYNLGQRGEEVPIYMVYSELGTITIADMSELLPFSGATD